MPWKRRNAQDSISFLSKQKVIPKKSPLTTARTGCSAPLTISAVTPASAVHPNKASHLTHTQPRLLQFHCLLWRYTGLHQARTPVITATCGGSGPISWIFPSQCCSAWGRAVWMCLGDFFSRDTCIWAKDHPACSNHPCPASFQFSAGQHFLSVHWLSFSVSPLCSLPASPSPFALVLPLPFLSFLVS